MAVIHLNGECHEVRAMKESDIAPGTLVKPRENRVVYRIVCGDGGDTILRNVRTPELLKAVPTAELIDYLFIAP